jgi:hypothetical protein
MTRWSFEADYFTACNCDWGCPCNFNARPTEGRCMGWCAWNITAGKFEETPLGGTRLVIYYKFPGLVEDGNGTGCSYIDRSASNEQQEALRAIAEGKAGGGIFELFGNVLVTKWLPTRIVPIEFEFADGVGYVRVDGFGEGESELLSYPDGSVIRPVQELPHGIEFKRALMTNARRWWWRDEELLADYANKYGAITRVKFTEEGCAA